MLKNLAVLVFILPIMGCAQGDDVDPMDVWYDWKDEISKNPVVSKAVFFPSKGGDLHIDLELDHEAMVAGGIDTLDTGITKEMCQESPLPVELWIKIPALDRNWYGGYDSEAGMFVINEIFEGSHPDLTPEYRVETQTFILRLPSEG